MFMGEYLMRERIESQPVNVLAAAGRVADNALMHRNHLAENLRSLMERHAVGENQLARATGVPQSTVHRIVAGESRDPRHSNLQRIAEYFGTTVPQLRGEEPMAASKVRDEAPATYDVKRPNARPSQLRMVEWDDDPDSLDESEYTMLPVLNVELAAGDGHLPGDETPQYLIPMRRHTIRRAGISTENCALVRVIGDSMEPRMSDGDLIGINTADRTVRDGKIYAIRDGDMLRVKVLIGLPGGGLRIRSYNRDDYPDVDLDAAQAQRVEIIGRAFWVSSMLD